LKNTQEEGTFLQWWFTWFSRDGIRSSPSSIHYSSNAGR